MAVGDYYTFHSYHGDPYSKCPKCLNYLKPYYECISCRIKEDYKVSYHPDVYLIPPIKVIDKEKRPLTIFCDIDGCILQHAAHPNGHITDPSETILLPGVREKFNEWVMKEYKIILTTGRKECTRKQTEDQLRHHGLVWDQLIMGLGGGIRVLINDRKPSTDRDTAVAVTIERNKGLTEVNI